MARRHPLHRLADAEEDAVDVGGEDLAQERRVDVADPALLVADTFECVVQINGKLRERVELTCGLPQDEVLAAVKALPRIAEQLEGREIVKEIVVPDKLVNIVVR